MIENVRFFVLLPGSVSTTYLLGAPGPDFGTWDTTTLNRQIRDHTVRDLALIA
jgi:hypothetical protein